MRLDPAVHATSSIEMRKPHLHTCGFASMRAGDFENQQGARSQEAAGVSESCSFREPSEWYSTPSSSFEMRLPVAWRNRESLSADFGDPGSGYEIDLRNSQASPPSIYLATR
jgi:hypothetical protein